MSPAVFVMRSRSLAAETFFEETQDRLPIRPATRTQTGTRLPAPWPSRRQANPENVLLSPKLSVPQRPVPICSLAHPGPAHVSRLPSSHKLAQKAHISGEKTTDFADSVLHHRNAFYAHAKGEAGDLFRIVGRLLLRR